VAQLLSLEARVEPFVVIFEEMQQKNAVFTSSKKNQRWKILIDMLPKKYTRGNREIPLHTRWRRRFVLHRSIFLCYE
jgi:hypothetical protein